MASDEEQNKPGGRTGFAGLSSMVSDVETAVTSTPKQTRRAASSSSSQQSSQTSRPTHEEQPRPIPQTYQSPDQPSSGSSTGRWLLWISVVISAIGAMWVANQSNNKSSSGPAYSTEASSTPVVSAPARQPPAAQPQAPSRPTENKPSVGRNNVLSTAQIRYCLAEKIRLDALNHILAETVLNSYVESDVERFKRYFTDYNSRCGEFRYRQGKLESARRDVEPYRGQLQAEGRSRLVHSPSEGRRTPTPDLVPQPRPSPDVTVQAIQHRLNELGYDTGVVDGLFGRKTRAAIQAFQRDNGIAVDGNASQSLLQKIILAEKRTPR